MKHDLVELLKRNRLYQRLLDEIDIGVHAIDEEGKTIIYNRKMAEIESMNVEDVLNKSILDIFMFSDDQGSTLIDALKQRKTTKNVKQTYFNNKGKEITTVNNTFPIIDNGHITAAIEIAKDVTQLEQIIKENILEKRNTKFTFDQIIGESEPMKEVIKEAKRATRTASSVLIVGETGTGKELFAQSIHNSSRRSSAPFISQNCAAIPENLMESLLFGTKKGAFTGATDQKGLFEQADGGTLLLDEINSLAPELQAKLLRVLQDKMIRKIGDTKEKEVNVRIIATINEDPIDAITNHHLRKDLYYRLSVVQLSIPPLRNRKEDIPLLAHSFMEKYNQLFNMHVQELDDEVFRLFYEHHWPGNVRELEHMIEGAMNLMEDERVISGPLLPARFRRKFRIQAKQPMKDDTAKMNTKDDNPTILKYRVMEVEKTHILKILGENNGNISRTAKILGISRQNLQYRLKKYGIR